jgi:hypothetical protein
VKADKQEMVQEGAERHGTQIEKNLKRSRKWGSRKKKPFLVMFNVPSKEIGTGQTQGEIGDNGEVWKGAEKV